jgi:hypothetical protein
MKGPVHSPFDTLSPVTPSPRGVGVYLASGDMKRPIGDLVRQLRDCSARWAALWVSSPDGRTIDDDRLRIVADALRGELGCDPWIWSFPAPDYPETALGALKMGMETIKPRGMILDIEKQPITHTEWSAPAARTLVRGVIDLAREGVGIGVTSYPVRSMWGHAIPWDELLVGHGQPQLYKSAAVNALRERSLREWTDAHGVVVPLVAGYLGDQERLREDLTKVCTVAGSLRVGGVGIWSLASLDGRERRVLREWGEQHGW